MGDSSAKAEFRTIGDTETGSSFYAPQPPVKDVLPESITTPSVLLEKQIIMPSFTIPTRTAEMFIVSAFSWCSSAAEIVEFSKSFMPKDRD
jgi:hypothetical protein